MIVPKKLVFLGFAYEMVWQKPPGADLIKLFKLKTKMQTGGGGFGLYSNASRTAIFFLPWRQVSIDEIERGGGSGAYRLSRDWSGYPADIAIRFHIPDGARNLSKIGVLKAVDYTSDKLEKIGDYKGKYSLYTHRYKTPLNLYADRSNSPRAYGASLRGKRIVTSRGLIG